MYGKPNWVEVDLDAIAYNCRQIKKWIGEKTELMAVVKGNAYGHGAVMVSKTALENGATRLAVARVDEGIQLRKAGVEAPILVLGYVPVDEMEEVVRDGYTHFVRAVKHVVPAPSFHHIRCIELFALSGPVGGCEHLGMFGPHLAHRNPGRRWRAGDVKRHPRTFVEPRTCRTDDAEPVPDSVPITDERMVVGDPVVVPLTGFQMLRVGPWEPVSYGPVHEFILANNARRFSH